METLIKKVAAEFLGVALFLTAITGATVSGSVLAPLSLAIALGIAILLTANISGGHLNPAVSLYFFARRAISATELLAYVVAQVLGATAGAALGSLIWNKGFSLPSADQGATPAAVTSELVATLVLVWIVGTLAKTGRGAIIPAAVALFVAGAAVFTSTGAQANPAVSIGLLFHPLGTHPIGTQAVLILAQFAGALLAVVLVNFFDEKPAK